jgi:CrcB protein
MVKILMIATGGGAGALLRYLIAGLVHKAAGGPLFPYGTLAVNVLGCFVTGLLFAYFSGPHLIRDDIRVALLVGLLGAFTTFSSFSWETLFLVRGGEMRLALANVALTNVLALSAMWFGYRIADKWFGA